MTLLLLVQLTVTITKGSITMNAPPPTPAEAAAILMNDNSDRNRTNVVALPRYLGPWSIVAPCWACDVQRLREARDVLTRPAWWDTFQGRSFPRSTYFPRAGRDAFNVRPDRTVIGPRR